MTDRRHRRAAVVGLASALGWAWEWAGPIATIIRPTRPVRLAGPGLPWAVDSAGPGRRMADSADPAAAVPVVLAAWAAAEATAAVGAAAADLLFWKKGKHTEARPVDEAARCAWRRAPIFCKRHPWRAAKIG